MKNKILDKLNHNVIKIEYIIISILTLLIIFSIYVTVKLQIGLVLLFCMWLVVSLIIIIGILFVLKIKSEVGEYKCSKCGNIYMPTIDQIYKAMCIDKDRYLKCPKCGQGSWNKKV